MDTAVALHYSHNHPIQKMAVFICVVCISGFFIN